MSTTHRPSCDLLGPIDTLCRAFKPDELFGLLKRELDLPPDLAAIVHRRIGDVVLCPSGRTITNDDLERVVIVRITPVNLDFQSVAAASLDQHVCSVNVSCRVALIPELQELRSFDRSIRRSAPAATRDDLARFLRSHVSQAVALAAEGRGVSVLLSPKSADDVSRELLDHLKPATFAVGITIEQITASFDCPVFRQAQNAKRRQEEIKARFDARRQIDAAVAEAQRARADQLAELLDKLRALAAENRGVELTELVKTFPELQRGEIYDALIATTDAPGLTSAVFVAAGTQLLHFDPRSLADPVRHIDVPDLCGGLRSVVCRPDPTGRFRLLVGAGTGVHELDPDSGQLLHTYPAATSRPVRGGVNAAELAGLHLFATHSELGLLRWRRQSEDPADTPLADLTAQAGAVRAVQMFDARLFFSVDTDILSVHADRLDQPPRRYTGSDSNITALCPHDRTLFAGNANGEIISWPIDEPDAPTRLCASRQRAAESLCVLNLGGVQRLFYTDTSLAVFARILGDRHVCRYEAGGQTLRRVEVAPDILVATNEIRDRIICFDPAHPDKRPVVVHIAKLTGHSVQDVCLVPAV